MPAGRAHHTGALLRAAHEEAGTVEDQWTPGVPGTAEAITLIATRIDESGWCLQAMTRREGEHIWDVTRLRFERLSQQELMDVADVLLSRALHIL